MTWDEYEKEILHYFQMKFEWCVIRRNHKIKGELSGTLRQIDVFVECQVAYQYIPIIIESKKWRRKLDVADVGSFIDAMRDVGVSKGFMVTQKGYSKPAWRRALSEQDLQLYILDFTKLGEDIGFWAVPYRGECGAVVSAPTGWVVNTKLPDEMNQAGLCVVYPMGLGLTEAIDRKDFMYFNIVPLRETYSSEIRRVFDIQNDKILAIDPKSTVRMWEEKIRGKDLLFREIAYRKGGYVEYSAGIETDYFISYLVAMATEESRGQSLARLRYTMGYTHFIVLKNADPNNSHDAWQSYLRKIPTML